MARLSPVSTRINLRAVDEVRSPVNEESHAVIHSGRVALITGAASGIGLAAAWELAAEGLKIVLADVDAAKLEQAAKALSAEYGEANVLAVPTDVSKLDQVQALADRTLETFGEVNLLMNNAGVGLSGSSTWSGRDIWAKILDVNLWGVINMLQVFTNSMIHQENPSMIINTGSKQGITSPPGNPAYNVSKAGVKVITENLSHELRTQGTKVTAHLFVPGWTHTGMTGSGNTTEKPAGAWTAKQCVQYMLSHVREGEFYIICPDNETSEDLDRLRIRWAADDLVERRPALSRWNPLYKPLFEEYIREGLHELNGGISSHIHSAARTPQYSREPSRTRTGGRGRDIDHLASALYDNL
ncbi:short-chain dehydrogenase/reductase SDR [Rhizoctonia solani AG-1 IB]|uniref:Short-chain dehydrogenase/reductase SDR n=1 Tax=Thanatephorus cucumeris (strain AG1-IB / isolate 7/3/14) TaxID=1108050 RepID=A0A0B7FXR3_THACB|nr:short-chain dehydrogenase/reductase SDR [Rhizoctonia solani AG-1 IB]